MIAASYNLRSHRPLASSFTVVTDISFIQIVNNKYMTILLLH